MLKELDSQRSAIAQAWWGIFMDLDALVPLRRLVIVEALARQLRKEGHKRFGTYVDGVGLVAN